MKRLREDSGTLPPAKRPAGESSEQPRLTTDDALQYLKNVKEKFKDDYGKYSEFLEVMKDFKAQRVDTAGVIDRVKNLFKGHNNLILGFNTFLPKGFQIVLPEEKKQPVEFDQAINFVNKIKNRFQDNEQVYKAFLEILNNYRKGTKSIGDVYEEVAGLFRDHSDLLEEFTRFLPDTNAAATVRAVKASNLQNQRAAKKEKAHDQPEHRAEKRKADKDKREDRKEDFDDLDNAQRLPHKRKSARRADELIRKQSQTGEGASFAFFDKVKARLRNNRDSYKELLKVVNLYNEQIINRAELQTLATDILEKYPELLEGFNELLQSENAEGYFGAVLASRKLECDTRKDREREKEDRDKDIDVKDKVCTKDKYLNKPISELDLSNCETCTPSYRLLPNYYQLPASHRNELAKSVLNDKWVSVTSGSEDYSFKHMRRNQYEELLFRCEDDRFELDMLLESATSTSKRVAKLLEKIQDPNSQYRSIDEDLQAIHLRAIERLYGDHGLDMLELLRKKPESTLPILLYRLKQKEEEWSSGRSEVNKIWSGVYAANYHKSLDHRSFYFKQQDKKSLSKRGLLAEIKEIHEKSRKEEEYIISTVMGNKRPFIPDLNYSFSDSSIHDDLVQIMKHSTDQVCSTMDQSDKLMKVWRLFLEGMFGLPSRASGTEDTEEAIKLQCRGSKALSSSTESAGSERPDAEPAPACSGNPDEQENREPVDEMEVDDVEERRKPPTASELGHEKNTKRKSPLRAQAESGATVKDSVSKVDREEGELSPSPDADEPPGGLRGEAKKELTYDGEHDADADDEGEDVAAMSSDDDRSGNASDAGEEVSGSELGTADDHEEAGDAREGKAESDDAEGMADADDTEADGILSLCADRSSMYCKPLAAHTKYLDAARRAGSIFYGSDKLYVLFRLYQTLHERVCTAKVNAMATEQKFKTGKDSPPPNLYEKFILALFDLLDGTSDNAKYEDECRYLIGTHSFVLFTLDKLIYKLVKQLQECAGDETSNKLLVLHAYEKSRGPASFSDLIYHANACVILHDETIYRFEHRSTSSEFVVQLMDGASEKFEVPPNAMELSFSTYLSEFLLSEGTMQRGQKIFLERNKRKSKATDLESAMKEAQVVNGLEYKISCKTSKVSYVLDTEDLFHRPRRQRFGGKSSCLQEKKCVCLGAGSQASGCGHVCEDCAQMKCCGHVCEACSQSSSSGNNNIINSNINNSINSSSGNGSNNSRRASCGCHHALAERQRRARLFREWIDNRAK